MDERFNIASYFLDRHLEAGDGRRVALDTRAGPSCYEEVAEMSNRAAGVFRDLGVGRLDRVLLALPDGPEQVAAFFGAARLGALAVPVNPFSRAAELLFFLEDCAPRVLVVDEGALRELKQARRQIRPDGLLVVGEAAPNWSWQRRLEDAEPHAEPAATAPEDPAFILYPSSGSGEPKGLFYSHQDLFHLSDRFGRRRLGIRAEDRVYSTAPISTAYGLGASLAFPFSVGAAVLLEAREPRPEAVYQAIGRFRPTLFFSVPAVYAALLNSAGDFDLASLRLAISAEQSLPPELGRLFRARFGREILDACGEAELTRVLAPEA